LGIKKITLFLSTNNQNKFMEIKTELRLHERIKEALDGRTQRWLSLNAKIPESELSRKMQGKLLFTDAEITRINESLKTDFIND
jgi:hypothetical protein